MLLPAATGADPATPCSAAAKPPHESSQPEGSSRNGARLGE